MALSYIAVGAAACLNFKIDTAIVLLFVCAASCQEIPINQVPDAFNQAVGQVTIRQTLAPVELSEDEAGVFRKLIANLLSIGMAVEPEQLALDAPDEGDLAKLASASDFEIRIRPKIAASGGYAKPTRSITASEGKKLETALLEVREWGFDVKAEII